MYELQVGDRVRVDCHPAESGEATETVVGRVTSQPSLDGRHWVVTVQTEPAGD